MSRRSGAGTACRNERSLDRYYIKPGQIDVLAVIHGAQTIPRAK
jgi:plasmid stabilization system protein ParE